MMVNFFLWNTIGIKLAGYLAVWLPAGSLSIYEWPLVVAGLLGITSGLLRAFLPFKKQAPPRKGFSLRPSRTTLMLAVVSLLVGAFMALPQNFSNVVLAERFAFGPESITTILTIAGILGWFGSLLVPWASGRLGELRGYVLVVALQGLLLVAWALREVSVGSCLVFGYGHSLERCRWLFSWPLSCKLRLRRNEQQPPVMPWSVATWGQRSWRGNMGPLSRLVALQCRLPLRASALLLPLCSPS